MNVLKIALVYDAGEGFGEMDFWQRRGASP